jgi:MbtH protein
MPNPFDDQTAPFLVLINQEGQYSIWPAFREPPAGWTAIGPKGGRQLCLGWIEDNWMDMRPKSLWRPVQQALRAEGAEEPPAAGP